MKQRWNEQKLVDQWILTEAEKELLNQRTDRGRIGCAILLKFLQVEGRFPVRQPDDGVREVLFPVVGEQTLAALVKEYHAKGPAYRHHVHTLLRSSNSHLYRVMLPPILDALTFRSNNTAHQPIIRALAWLKANRNSHKQFIACDELSIDSVVRPQLQ